jgi:hypothetical protein
MSPTRLAFAFSLAVAAACGGSSSSTNLAANAASAYCSYLQRCNAHTSLTVVSTAYDISNFELAFASMPDCVTELTASFTPVVSLPGVSSTEVNADIAILDSGSCGAAVSHLSSQLTSWGGLNAGAACSNDLQCSTGHCSATNSASCGACVGGANGAACDANTPCAEPLGCISATCQARFAIGTACTVNNDCTSGFCINSLCADATTGVTTGGACSDTTQCAYPLVCNATSKSCVNSTITYQPVGSSCGGLAQCSGGYCDATTKICTAFLNIGSSCNPSVTTPSNAGCRFACVGTAGSTTVGTCQGSSTAGLTCN